MDELEKNLDFMDAGIDLTALTDIHPAGQTAVLERLGPAHFRSKGFSFMGFLQTVYDHVAQTAAVALPVADQPVAAATEEPVPAANDLGDTMDDSDLLPNLDLDDLDLGGLNLTTEVDPQ
jgi:hypothetical protein